MKVSLKKNPEYIRINDQLLIARAEVNRLQNAVNNQQAYYDMLCQNGHTGESVETLEKQLIVAKRDLKTQQDLVALWQGKLDAFEAAQNTSNAQGAFAKVVHLLNLPYTNKYLNALVSSMGLGFVAYKVYDTFFVVHDAQHHKKRV